MSGQEDQRVAALLAERAAHSRRRLVLEPIARIAAEHRRVVDRETAPETLDDRRIVEQPRDPRTIERGRHHEHAQVFAQAALRVERKRKSEIGVERTFMEFVEQHRRDAGEFRIVEDHAREHALGNDLDPRPAR